MKNISKAMQNPVMRIMLILLIPSLFVFFWSVSDCFAGDNTATFFLDTFKRNTDSWWSVLQGYAKTIFLLTLTLEVVIFGARMALQQSQLGEIISQFVMTLLFAAFIAAVIMNYQEWATKVALTGLKSISTELTPKSSDAGSSWGLAAYMWETVSTVCKEAGWQQTPKVIILYLLAMILVIAFSLIAALYIIVTCEFYIVANVGILLVGLGGSKLFKDYAINVMRYVLSVGVKLFVLQLIVNIGFTILTLEVAAGATGGKTIKDVDFFSMFLLIGQCIILLALAKSLPETVSGILSGSHISNGNPLASTARSLARNAVKAVGVGVGVGAGAAAAGKVLKAAGSSDIAKAAGVTGFKGRVGLMAKNIMNARSQANIAKNPNSMTSILKSQANMARTMNLAKESNKEKQK